MAKPSDLTDEDTLRALRPIRRDDAATTTKIALLIDAMSDAVRRYTQRQFLGKAHGIDLEAEEAVERTFRYDGSGYLSLAPYEARDIESVTLDGTTLAAVAAGSSIGTSRYLAEPVQQTPEGTYLYLTLPERRDCSPDRPRLVTVTARWGIVDLPGSVELATLHAVADGFVNPEGAARRDIGDGIVVGEDNDPNGGSLPRAARQLLGPLVRRA